jgi:hypothetical protein
MLANLLCRKMQKLGTWHGLVQRWHDTEIRMRETETRGITKDSRGKDPADPKQYGSGGN